MITISCSAPKVFTGEHFNFFKKNLKLNLRLTRIEFDWNQRRFSPASTGFANLLPGKRLTKFSLPTNLLPVSNYHKITIIKNLQRFSLSYF